MNDTSLLCFKALSHYMNSVFAGVSALTPKTALRPPLTHSLGGGGGGGVAQYGDVCTTVR